MLRSVILLLLAAMAATPALAGEPGPRELTDGVELRSGVAGLGLVASASRTVEETGLGRHVREVSMAGLGWQRGGFKATATAGLFVYDFTGAGQGTARAASFAVSHVLATALGGSLSVELRHDRLWAADSQLEATSARLGWSLRF